MAHNKERKATHDTSNGVFLVLGADTYPAIAEHMLQHMEQAEEAIRHGYISDAVDTP